MKVTIRLQGDLRRHVPSSPQETDLPDGATVSDAIAALGIRPGEVWLVRLDEELVDKDHILQTGDELSLIPPVAGGQLWYKR
jgi:molybdopterin converting factor small subunit